MTEVESIISDNDITISTTDRGIIINGSDNNIVEVYNVSGQCVYSGTVSIIPLTTNGCVYRKSQQ